ncbi:MAG: HipA domain-containing protein, partial [Anaeroplasmataceae bacterium]|nr:HipA domain-containing protein [Anaeroplasmataceae bacterium]
MKCLCCGKELHTNLELDSLWHSSCVKKFFSTSKLPSIDLTTEALEELANSSIAKGYTIPGVQKKLSLHLSTKENNLRLTLVNYPTGYIFKPQTPEYSSLPEAEYLVMQMARLVGIRTVPFALVQMKSDNSLAYITKRIDRKIINNSVEKLAMEDFCQLENRLTQDKYHSSYERCAKVIQRYSSYPGLDLVEFFLRIVFSFAVGNSDMHLKNFSLIETAHRSQEYKLSEAYDLLPVNTILPQDQEELALTLHGKKRNLGKNDFLAFAETCGINKKSAIKMIASVTNKDCHLYTYPSPRD